MDSFFLASSCTCVAFPAQPKMLKIHLENFAEKRLENFAEICFANFAEIHLENFVEIVF